MSQKQTEPSTSTNLAFHKQFLYLIMALDFFVLLDVLKQLIKM